MPFNQRYLFVITSSNFLKDYPLGRFCRKEKFKS